MMENANTSSASNFRSVLPAPTPTPVFLISPPPKAGPVHDAGGNSSHSCLHHGAIQPQLNETLHLQPYPPPFAVSQQTSQGDLHSSGTPPQILSDPQIVGLHPTSTLPSLLRYTDHDLMQFVAHHNHPPSPGSTCSVCFSKWDSSTTIKGQSARSTYLPLTCGHFLHYRCFIWLTTRSDDRQARCNVCQTKLFEWEGITALTVATRLGLDMQDGRIAMSETDEDRYKDDCNVIQNIVQAEFFKHLKASTKHEDGSPQLTQCFYDVLQTLFRMNKPRSRWLQYKTNTGYLLWTTLVAIKMRRYLVEKHEMIQSTESWKWFELGIKDLHDKITADVHQ